MQKLEKVILITVIELYKINIQVSYLGQGDLRQDDCGLQGDALFFSGFDWKKKNSISELISFPVKICN